MIPKALNVSQRKQIFLTKKTKYYNFNHNNHLYKNKNHLIDIHNKKSWDFESIDARTKELSRYLCENIIKE